jgi:methylenetetrahydrofolate reductase (NADPH)
MKIRERLLRPEPTFSFEFFPPRDESGMRDLFETIRQLEEYGPDYVSVTYGAGGSTRRLTIQLVCQIKAETGIETMAHLTAAGSGRDELGALLDQLAQAGIENVLPLRGDPPHGEGGPSAHPDGFAHAADFVAFIRVRWADTFCLAGACYPQKHPEAPDLGTDLARLKAKVDQGIDLLITQLFFDNERYFSFVRRARELGILVPIIAGIMPITSLGQIKRFTATCGVEIPPELLGRLEAAGGDPARVRAIGVAHATEQCRDLLRRGAPGIHFYTLNRSPATVRILEALR